jgi:hypothetical protein
MLNKEGYLIREDNKNYAQKRRPAKEASQRFIVVSVSRLLK